ncbi:MAG: hypothetical protein OEM02_07960 [Desulfobulbaceae bacterium]|nr:hypothetical protein [Desulfobulbaceae bacterium]
MTGASRQLCWIRLGVNRLAPVRSIFYSVRASSGILILVQSATSHQRTEGRNRRMGLPA